MSPYNSEVGGSRPHSQPLSSSPLSLLPPNTSQTGTHQVKAVSFDDYHMFWKGLATSVSGNNTGSKSRKDSGTLHCTCMCFKNNAIDQIYLQLLSCISLKDKGLLLSKDTLTRLRIRWQGMY